MKKRYMVEQEFTNSTYYTSDYGNALIMAQEMLSLAHKETTEEKMFNREHETEILINWLNDAGEWVTIKTFKIFDD